MKLKFHSDLDGPLPRDVSLYLKCPRCKQVALWKEYPNNPVLSMVVCAKCGFSSMGSAFQKATKKKKQPSLKEKRILLESHKQFHAGQPLEKGIPLDEVAHLLASNKPLMGVLNEIAEGHLIINDPVMKLIRKGQRLGLLKKDAGFYLLTPTGEKVLEESREFGWLPESGKK